MLKRFISIRYVLPLSIALPLVLATGLTTMLAFRSGRHAIDVLSLELSNKALLSIKKHIVAALEVPQLVNRYNAIAAGREFIDPNNFEVLPPYFLDQVKSRPSAFDIYFGSENGDFLQVKKFPNGQVSLFLRDRSTAPRLEEYTLDNQGRKGEKRVAEEQYDPRLRPWYTQAKEVGNLTWSPIYVFAGSRKLGISSTVPVYNPQGDFIGAFGIDYQLREISDFLAELNISPRGVTFIIEPSGDLVASSTLQDPYLEINGKPQRLPAVQSQEPVIQFTMKHLSEMTENLADIQEQIGFSYRLQGQRQLVQVAPLQENLSLDWLVVVAIPDRDFTELVYGNIRFIIVIGAIVTGMATVLGVIASQWIVRPVGELYEATKALKAANFDAIGLQKIASRPDEIGELSQTFLEMAETIDTRQKSLGEKLEEITQKNEESRRSISQGRGFNLEDFKNLIDRARKIRQKHSHD